MKISYNENGATILKDQDWSVEECESKGGHCWVEFQSQYGFNNSFPPKIRTCKHCGLVQEQKIIHQESWESI